ncbi:MAG: hypothetical protein QOG67_2681 [Verrucomicrobiota bacterium]|jgi:thiol:disulfide interchange protein DsbD
MRLTGPAAFSAGLAFMLLIMRDPCAAQTYEGRELVKAQLIADATAVVAGKPFTVGLLLHMVPGWHTYWKFPGDAGIPTELKWKLPNGWKVGEIQWPIPLKLADPGDIQTYGYADEVLLMQQITPPASIAGSTVRLAANANWLVCEKICIPGSAEVALELPIGSQAGPANQEQFARFRRLLPQEWPGPEAAHAKWSRSGSNLRLIVDSSALSKQPAVDFYPLPDANVVVGHPSVDGRHGTEVTFRIPLESADKSVTQIQGLVVFASQPNSNDRAAWSTPKISGVAAAGPPSQGLLTLFFFGFIGGAILNLMPCVLPVISLKIFGFVQQAGQSRRRILRSGLAFAAGIFAWFIALGALLIGLKSAGHQITWAFQFTNAYFVFGMGVIVLVFALNLFGVFEISLPQSASRGMLGVAESKGDTGSFFQGVFATLLATPCTAPYLGTALGFAFAQSAIIIMGMFLSIAAGMAFPYVLLCAQPAWLRFLPKPGPWMVHVKQLMGFLLLGTLLFLLYVLGAQRGLDGLIWASCFLLVVSIACWMKGTFLVPTASMRTRVIALLLIATMLGASGAYFIGDKFRSSKLAATGSQMEGDWHAFSAELLQSELDQGHAVFVDFTAAWCLNCKFNERQVLENATVREAFQRHGVTKLKADWTNGDPVITSFLQRFGRVGVPFYVLYSGKSEDPIVFPELLTKNMVLEKLESISRAVASE